jgi:hypothetical protein
MIQYLHSTHTGHHQIEQDDVNLIRTGLDFTQTLVPILSADDSPTVLGKDPGAALTHDLLIIDDKNVYLIGHLSLNVKYQISNAK